MSSSLGDARELTAFWPQLSIWGVLNDRKHIQLYSIHCNISTVGDDLEPKD